MEIIIKGIQLYLLHRLTFM